jgi:DICT domain-containing protein
VPDPSLPRRPSVFATVAPNGAPLLAAKATLIAFSHVIEDESRADLGQAHLFGLFQRPRFYEYARATWEELAAKARSAHVFAEFDTTRRPGPGPPVEVALGPDADELRREWAVIVDRPRGAMALAARERPARRGSGSTDRLFDSAWTTDPETVRRAARICAVTAHAADSPRAQAVLYELSLPIRDTLPGSQLEQRLADRLAQILASPGS